MEIDPRLHPPVASFSASEPRNALVAPSVPVAPGDEIGYGPSTFTAQGGSYSQFSPANRPGANDFRSRAGAEMHTLAERDASDTLADLRRPRACDACRQLKVRCQFDSDEPNGACKRCAKAKRTCIVTAPTRKRQKKTDSSRVAELERKIDALTATLQASQQARSPLERHDQEEFQFQSTTVGGNSNREEPRVRRWLGAEQHQQQQQQQQQRIPGDVTSLDLRGSKRQHSDEASEQVSTGGYSTPVYPSIPRLVSPSADNVHDQHPFAASVKQWHTRSLMAPPTVTDPGPEVRHEPADMIDTGVLTAGIAAQTFDRYIHVLAPQMPFVVFPPGTGMDDIRRSKPILFHAIIAFSIGPIKPSVQASLVEYFYRILAERMIINGEKSLELVQAMVVSCFWYMPPDRFEELKVYQITHSAALMAIDLGLNRTSSAHKKHFNLMRDMAGKKLAISVDLDAPETRRTWLACYFICTQISTALRRVLLIRWQSYMDECIEILESSPDSLPSDKMIIHWAKFARLMEDISFQFSVDDPGNGISVSDSKVLYTLKAFERQLQQWREDVPAEHYSPLTRQFENILNIYMHEVSMHADYDCEEQKRPVDAKAEESSTSSIAAHVNALSSCISSIHETIEIMSGVDVVQLISFPTIALARASYAAVALIKLYSIVSEPNNRIGQVIDPASLKVEHSLDQLVGVYKAAGDCAGGRTPATFATMLVMLRNWFLKCKEQGSTSLKQISNQRPDSRPSMPSAMVTDRDSPITCSMPGLATPVANINVSHMRNPPCPLHLLSEVAMVSSEATSRPSSAQTQHSPFHPTISTQRPLISASPAAQVSDTIPTGVSSPSPSNLLDRGASLTTPSTLSNGTAAAPQQDSCVHKHFSWPVPDPSASVPLYKPPSSSAQSQPAPIHGSYFPAYAPGHPHPQRDIGHGTNAELLMYGNAAARSQAQVVPDLGSQVGFDPEDVFALGSMLDDWFYFPMTLDGGMGLF